jgi:hypothetical protein
MVAIVETFQDPPPVTDPSILVGPNSIFNDEKPVAVYTYQPPRPLSLSEILWQWINPWNWINSLFETVTSIWVYLFYYTLYGT